MPFSELLNMITTCYALGYYFKKASDASYLTQMNLGPLISGHSWGTRQVAA